MKTESIICSTQIITALVSQETMEIDAMELRRKELSLKRKALFAKIPKGFSEILTGKLWLGSGRDARQKKKLLELGITHIVNCAIEWKNHYPSTFMYFNGNVLDNEKQDLSVFFSGAFDFLDEVLRVPSNRVFIHCVVGKSRSAALTMAYLMRMEHLTLNQAYNHVKACRPIVSPNDGFMRQLMAFEMHMFSTTSPSMVWGEWKNQSKCALAPLDSISQDQDNNNINSNNKENFPSSSSLDKDNEMTNTTTTTSNNTNNNNDDLLTRSPQAKYHRTELQQAALDSFVQTHITPELLQKGLTEVCGGVYDRDCVGNLLQWVHHGIRDSTSCAEGVRREGIPWRDIAHSIDESAKQWLRQQEHSTKTDVAT